MENCIDSYDRVWIRRNNGFGGSGMEKTLESDSCEFPYTARGIKRLDGWMAFIWAKYETMSRGFQIM